MKGVERKKIRDSQAALEEAANKEKMVAVRGGERFPSPSPINLTELDFCLFFIFQNHDFRFGYKIAPSLLHTAALISLLSRVLNETGSLNSTMTKNNNKIVHAPNSTKSSHIRNMSEEAKEFFVLNAYMYSR